MSSQIKVIFQHDQALEDERQVTFNIRHFRNHRKNKNGGMELDPFGGYTVLSEEGNGKLFVAKCNPRTDKFNRKEGLKQAIGCYMKCRFLDKFNRQKYPVILTFNSVDKDTFLVSYENPIEAPF